MISQIVGSISSFALYVIDSMGYFGVFLLMALESFNIPIPSEVIMPFAGFLAAKGSMSFWWVVALGVVGNLVGSIFNYYLGYFGGRSFLIKFGKYFFVMPAGKDIKVLITGNMRLKNTARKPNLANHLSANTKSFS